MSNCQKYQMYFVKQTKYAVYKREISVKQVGLYKMVEVSGRHLNCIYRSWNDVQEVYYYLLILVIV